jgi:hypothetical protein
MTATLIPWFHHSPSSFIRAWDRQRKDLHNFALAELKTGLLSLQPAKNKNFQYITFRQ